MIRQRTSALILILLLFAAVTAVVVLRILNVKQTRYRVGEIPADVVNQLVPRDVPLSAMRPPALRLTDPVRFGGATSVMSVIEYGDYECEACRTLHDELLSVLPSYLGRVRFVWRDFPIEEDHPNALFAAVFARCAGVQGAYWEAHDALMTRMPLNERTFQEIAAGLRLNADVLRACRNDPSLASAIRKDVEESRADGVKATPFLFIGTKPIEGSIDADTLKREIDQQLSSF